jgi:hypothetical protein
MSKCRGSFQLASAILLSRASLILLLTYTSGQNCRVIGGVK